MNKIKTIALVDSSWMGHHPMYFKVFVSALAELGIRVLPFCPAPDDLTELLGNLRAEYKNGPLQIERPEAITFPPPSRIRPGRLRPIQQAIRYFGGLGNRLRAWEKMSDCKIDLVFFACIYDAQFEWMRYAEPFFRFPWSGLYLHARSFRMPGSPIPFVGRLPCPEKFFTLKSVHSLAALDEGAVTPLQKLANGRPVVAFPDFTDVDLPPQGDAAWGLANKIREFAGGRPVVSLLGHLQRTKGMEEFTHAAKDESLRDLFFFLGGDVNWMETSAASKEAMLKTWERSPNLLTYLQRITDEKTLNAVIASSDIIYAAYTDFPNSSNVLTKAAFFEKPVIVSDGYLMAERTRDYQMGEVVKEGDLDAIKAALRRLGGLDKSNPNSVPRRWKEYQAAHSRKRLVRAFAELLSLRPSERPVAIAA